MRKYGNTKECKNNRSGARLIHHRKKTFQKEYLEFLKEYNIEYDERYLWD
jgi:hypothetical protein